MALTGSLSRFVTKIKHTLAQRSVLFFMKYEGKVIFLDR